MYNFSKKYEQHQKRKPIEMDFKLFWENIQENYFLKPRNPTSDTSTLSHLYSYQAFLQSFKKPCPKKKNILGTLLTYESNIEEKIEESLRREDQEKYSELYNSCTYIGISPNSYIMSSSGKGRTSPLNDLNAYQEHATPLTSAIKRKKSRPNEFRLQTTEGAGEDAQGERRSSRVESNREDKLFLDEGDAFNSTRNLLGYNLYISPYDRARHTQSLHLDSQIHTLNKKIGNLEKVNKLNFRSVRRRLLEERMKSENEMKNMYREELIEYLRHAIITLEYKQLSESIVSIKDVDYPHLPAIATRSSPNGSRFPSLKGRKNRSGCGNSQGDQLEYLAYFDPSINIPPMWIKRDKIVQLNYFREDIMTTSLYDANLAAKQKQILEGRNSSAGLRLKQEAGSPSKLKLASTPTTTVSKSGLYVIPYQQSNAGPMPKWKEEVLRIKEERRKSLMGDKGIKQLGNLLDPEIIGVHINFNKYGLCHHCKQLKLKELMVSCKYKSSKMGIAVPCATTINGTTIYNVDINSDNLNALNVIKGKKQNGRGHCRRQEYSCKKEYCHFCITSNYDQEFTEVTVNKSWVCPYCQGICYCTRCMRQDQMTKLRALYVSLGGLSSDLKLSDSPLDEYISMNFDRIEKAIVRGAHSKSTKNPPKSILTGKRKCAEGKVMKIVKVDGEKNCSKNWSKNWSKKMKRYRRLRMDFEESRVLLDLALRREKMKKNLMETNIIIFENERSNIIHECKYKDQHEDEHSRYINSYIPQPPESSMVPSYQPIYLDVFKLKLESLQTCSPSTAITHSHSHSDTHKSTATSPKVPNPNEPPQELNYSHTNINLEPSIILHSPPQPRKRGRPKSSAKGDHYITTKNLIGTNTKDLCTTTRRKKRTIRKPKFTAKGKKRGKVTYI